jgi:hypothetical protein
MVCTTLRWREIPPIPAKFTSYSSKMQKQRLDPPISVPIPKARSPAHDGGRPRMKTPPRARTQPFSLAFGNDQDAPKPVLCCR